MSGDTSYETDTTVRETCALYTQLALHPEQDFGWNKGKENARTLGYDPQWLQFLPDRAWESSAAVGNLFGLGPIKRGEIVVDIGCGAGVDLCIAALLVGNEGRVIGIDITPAMVAKARENVQLAGLHNVEIYQADMAALPLEDGCADIVISNGSINLSPRKPCVFKEMFRILRPGGRVQFADMVQDSAAEPSDSRCHHSWAGCVSGTVLPERYLDMLKSSGFEAVECVSFTDYRTAETTIGATFRAAKPSLGHTEWRNPLGLEYVRSNKRQGQAFPLGSKALTASCELLEIATALGLRRAASFYIWPPGQLVAVKGIMAETRLKRIMCD